MSTITVTCNNCHKSYPIGHDKLDKTRQKLGFKCSNCGQMVVFVNPTFVQNVKSEDFTDPPIAPNVIKSQTFKPRLIEIASGKVYLLKKGNNIIGREADLFGDHPDNYISRFHCKIEVVSDADPRRVLLIDDGKINDGKPSANGTFHNNVRLTTFDKIILTDGDKVRIGHTDLIYQSV